MTEQVQDVMTGEVLSDDVHTEKYLTFFIDGQLFAIPSSQVVEIIRMQAITYMPKLPYYIKGVINLRGKIVPVIDVRAKFGKEEVTYDERTSIIVADIDEMGIGLIVDTVNDVTDISDDQISSAPKISQDPAGAFVEAIAHLESSVAMLLDSIQLIADDAHNLMLNPRRDSSSEAE